MVLRIVKNLYANTKVHVLVTDELSDFFPCNVGVRQGAGAFCPHFLIFA